jgi:NAD(P)-dependent dehydrogenase (short-subunit alcohol dehydrogenase family)
MSLNLQPGQTAVITGAGSGFGLELARLGAKKGLNLVLTDVQQDALDAAVAELTAAGAKVAALRGDVSRAEDVQALADLCKERFGAPHIVVNNAGVAPLVRADLLEMTEESYDRVMGINAKGTMFLTQLVANQMSQGSPPPAVSGPPGYRSFQKHNAR